MSRIKDFYHEELAALAESDFSSDAYGDHGPTDRAFPPTPEPPLPPHTPDVPYITTISVLMCQEGSTPPRPVNAFTFAADARRVLSWMEMGKRAHVLPDDLHYYIVEVPYDPEV